ncbi:hypothetical protein V8F33_002042 [Rhypophila sp. PSN 637]
MYEIGEGKRKTQLLNSSCQWHNRGTNPIHGNDWDSATCLREARKISSYQAFILYIWAQSFCFCLCLYFVLPSGHRDLLIRLVLVLAGVNGWLFLFFHVSLFIIVIHISSDTRHFASPTNQPFCQVSTIESRSSNSNHTNKIM